MRAVTPRTRRFGAPSRVEEEPRGAGDREAPGRPVTRITPAAVVSPPGNGLWQAIRPTQTPLRGQATLDTDGQILAVSGPWSALAARCGLAPCDVGDRYTSMLTALPARGRLAVNGIRDVLLGRSDDFVIHLVGPFAGLAVHAQRLRGRERHEVVVTHEELTHAGPEQGRRTPYAAVLDDVDAAIFASDSRALITQWNAAAEVLYGWKREEAVDRPLEEVLGSGFPPEMYAALLAEGHWDGEVTAQRKDGGRFSLHLRTKVMRGADGTSTGILHVGVPLAAGLPREPAMPLTRDYLLTVADRLEQGVIALDLEGRVRHLNRQAEELLGWTLDELEGQVMHDAIHHTDAAGAQRPRSASPILSRIGAAVLPGDAGAAVAEVPDDVFHRRDGTSLPVSYSVAPIDTGDGFRGLVVMFTDLTAERGAVERNRKELETFARVTRVRDAIESSSFELYAQPIAAVDSGVVVQHELLLRLLDDQGNPEPPAPYLIAAERHGLIGDVDRWVVGQAMDLAADGHAVELNVSACSVSDPAFVSHVERELRRSGADPSLVVVELTETALVSNQSAAQTFTRRITELGCRVALDDFGAGYGGFNYLKHLSLHYLKIDMEFVRDISDNAASRQVVETIVALAKGFGLQTVAEGVEEPSSMRVLEALGVDFAQGYCIGRPAPLDATLTLTQDISRRQQ